MTYNWLTDWLNNENRPSFFIDAELLIQKDFRSLISVRNDFLCTNWKLNNLCIIWIFLIQTKFKWLDFLIITIASTYNLYIKCLWIERLHTLEMGLLKKILTYWILYFFQIETCQVIMLIYFMLNSCNSVLMIFFLLDL